MGTWGREGKGGYKLPQPWTGRVPADKPVWGGWEPFGILHRNRDCVPPGQEPPALLGRGAAPDARAPPAAAPGPAPA